MFTKYGDAEIVKVFTEEEKQELLDSKNKKQKDKSKDTESK